MTDPLLIEQWVEYSIGIAIFFLRFFARYKVVGLNGMTYDDLFASIAMILFTVDTVTVQLIRDHGSFVGLNVQSADALSDDVAASYAIGSKSLFVAWISYVSLVWCMKGSLLSFYNRLTLGTLQQKLVKIMAIVCIVSYIGVILTLFLHCTPIQKNWQVKPYAGDQCTLTVANYVVVAATNVITDACILIIPMPLIWKVRLPLRRKIVIGLLLSSGLFVITAALLRCILSLQSVANIGNSTSWGIRETFVAILAVSAPAIKPLFNKSQWIGSTDQKGGSTGYSGKGFRRFGLAGTLEAGNQTPTLKVGKDLENDDWKKGDKGSILELKEMGSRHGSQDRIIGDEEQIPHSKNVPLEINVTHTYANNETAVTEEKSVGTTGLMPFRTKQWGLNTEISSGDRKQLAKASKASRMMGVRDTDLN